MGISPSLSIALTGLRAHQEALEVTSNNISNSSNPDYVRERAVFSSLSSTNSIPGDMGNGVEISKIYRITNTFLFNRYTSTNANFKNLDTKEKFLKEISTYFPDVTDNGLYKNLEDFFNAWQTFASNPNDGSVKVDLAAKTQTLTDTIKTLTGKLKDIQKNINDELSTKTDEVNNIIKQIANINKEIIAHEAGNLKNANELRDKRDALEKRLKELVDVKVFKSGIKSTTAEDTETIGNDKNYTITLGGYPLVDNSNYSKIKLESIVGNAKITIQRQDFTNVDITKDINGGEIGALLSLRGTEFNKKGDPVNGSIGNLMNKLNALANGLIRSVNSIYSYSAQESVTTDTLYNPSTVPADKQNTPLSALYQYGILHSEVRSGKIELNIYDKNGNFSSSIDVDIDKNDSINQVIKNINNKIYNNDNNADYGTTLINGQLKFVKGSYDSSGNFIPSIPKEETSQVLVNDDGANLFIALNELEYQPLSKINTTQLPLPLKNGKFDIIVYNDKGESIAKRTITVNMDSRNPKYSTLEGIISQINTPNIDDNSDNNLGNDIDDYYQASFLNGKLLFSKKTDENTFIGLDNDTSDFGGSMGVNKFFNGTDASNIELKKTFQADPSLIKASKTPNSGDNIVANNILQLQYEKVNFYVKGNTVKNTLFEFYRNTTSSLANETESVSNKKETTETLLKSVKNEYYSLTGVSIDEELINLEKFQRGYQANARVITTINKMLDALFSIQ